VVVQPRPHVGFELAALIAELGELDEVLKLEVVDVVDQGETEVTCGR